MHSFKIVPTDNGFQITDTDTFNNWGTMKTIFATEILADDYAWACHMFKIGRAMSVRDCPTGF